jgi:hypothetical protein
VRWALLTEVVNFILALVCSAHPTVLENGIAKGSRAEGFKAEGKRVLSS